MIKALEKNPTVEGVISDAWIGEAGDWLHVDGLKVEENIGALTQVAGDEDNPDPSRPFWLISRAGTLAKHGYINSEDLIGKLCFIWSDIESDCVAIEPKEGDDWQLVTWREHKRFPTVEDLL